MRQVSEVLRLRAEGLSLRQIGRSLGIGVTTAHEYLWRASAAGLEWPLPEGLDAEELEARLLRREDLESWLGLHVRALEFFGGVTRVLVPDNLKAGVTKACWYEPELNPSYLELARYYGTVILPTRPRHPRDKVLAFDCTSSAGFDTSGLGALIVEPVVCDRGRAATRTLPGHPHPASGRAAVPCRCRRPRRGGRPAASA